METIAVNWALLIILVIFACIGFVMLFGLMLFVYAGYRVYNPIEEFHKHQDKLIDEINKLKQDNLFLVRQNRNLKKEDN